MSWSKGAARVSLVFTAEQEEMRHAVRAFLIAESPSTEVRRLMETPEGIDRDVWNQMAAQLELHGLAVPEEFGGSGFGPVEQLIVFEECGRALLCAPFFGTVALAIPALLAAGDPAAAKDLLPGLVSGAIVATLAFTEDDGDWNPGATQLRAEPAATDEGAWTLTGAKSFVIDGAAADLFLVVGRTSRGLSLFAVQADAPSLQRVQLETLDLTRKQVRLSLDGTPARLIGADGAGQEILERTLNLAAVLLAAEQVGGAQACLDLTVEYAKVRTQFGRPIGSFQAIKHRCADMLVALESARSAAYHAAWTAAEAPDELPAAAAMAKAMASEAYNFCAGETIQLHGGIGFTWEHDAHLYYRRAHSTALFLGDAVYQRELLADRLGI
jgi:alkylation response protein AidB-like acyl-CoA dehydrogenase